MKQILIDAIKLKKDLPKNADYYEALAWIDEAEEVEAIPIEWIEKWIDSNWEYEADYIVDEMIEDWKEENAESN